MEKLLNVMMEAGLEVKFCRPDHIQVFPKGSAAWWHASSLDVAYKKGVEAGWLKEIEPDYDRRNKHLAEHAAHNKIIKEVLQKVKDGVMAVKDAQDELVVQEVVYAAIHEEIGREIVEAGRQQIIDYVVEDFRRMESEEVVKAYRAVRRVVSGVKE